MISPPIADGLNEKQRQSVTLSEDINALILAGAGSGKTRVLTHRIQYLVSEKNHHTDDILAVTFTNKAANEMKERLTELLYQPIGRMWVGTFHSLAHRLIRTHAIEANLSPTFQILDAQDQYRIIKRLMKENAIDESKFPIRKVQWFINQQKDEGSSHKILMWVIIFLSNKALKFLIFMKGTAKQMIWSILQAF
jgi:DNA helicase-2/ATP-dependent DNA helicase PcrA